MSSATSFICLSHAAADRAATEGFRDLLAGFGFTAVCMDESTPIDLRDDRLNRCAALLVMASPAASDVASCLGDLQYMMSLHRPVLCIRLAPSALEDRLVEDNGAIAERFIPYPYAETAYPDDRAVAMFLHRLLIRHLCRLTACFDPTACTDPTHGAVIRAAVRAWQGDAYAQYVVGLAYDRGDTLPHLDTEAAAWMTKASLAHHTEAMLYLGNMKLRGDGVEKDPAGALALFRHKRVRHDPRGQFAIGLCYLYGYGVMKDPEMALHCMTRAAEGDYTPAYYRLGLMYRDGIGVPYRDWKRAVDCLYAACRAEGLDAPLYGRCIAGRHGDRAYRCVSMRHMRQLRLGDRLMAATHPHWREDPALAAKVKRAFARSTARVVGDHYPEDPLLHDSSVPYDTGHADLSRGYTRQSFCVSVAADALGRLLESGSPRDHIPPAPRAALAWFRRALRLGHSGAMYHLGELYRNGSGVPAGPTQAVALFRMCADRQDVQGLFALGVCYERGIGVPPDLPTAVTQYEKAARAGYAPAQNNLGGCYEHGLGVTRNPAIATEWYSKATAAGHPRATCRLGICYENGTGVTRNEERAFHLYERAAERGLPYAMYRLARCYDRGIYVTAQPTMAAHLYERAADGGVAEASYAFGLCCTNGHGARRDEREGFLRLSEAADRGHVRGAYQLGLCYAEGRAALQSLERAMQAWIRAAALFDRKAATLSDEDEETATAIREAAADAMFRVAYHTLYGVGQSLIPNDPISDDLPTAGTGRPTEASVKEALSWFRRAAALGHKDAYTAIGDLYAYNLIPATDTATATKGEPSPKHEAEARRAYESAARLGQCEAMLSLSETYRHRAETLISTGDPAAAEEAYTHARALLETCAEQGDRNAEQALAAYTHFRWGTSSRPSTNSSNDRSSDPSSDLSKDKETLAHLIRATEGSPATGRPANRSADRSADYVTAYLWLGDAYYEGRPDGIPRLAAADEAYRRAAAPDTDAPCPPHMLRERWKDRMAHARYVQAEAYYRLAILRAVGFTDDQRAAREQAFAYLAAAILAGHEGALDDLARMYAYETACADEAAAALAAADLKQRLPKQRLPKKARRAKADRSNEPSSDPTAAVSASDGKNLTDTVDRRHDHLAWMTAYYTARRPTLVPFAFTPIPKPRDNAPAYVTTPVTATMRGCAMNHLGDCFFEGKEIPVDHAAAVDCYRRAAEVRQPRGEAPAPGLIWAKYSLGWCLVNGEGTAPAPREGVRFLTEAARYHADAAFCLGLCFQSGTGVDRRNVREAVKYFRKANALRHPEAAAKLKMLEKQLK